MIVSVPKYQVILSVKKHGEWEIYKEFTHERATMRSATRYWQDTNHWQEDWEAIRIISVYKVGVDKFDVPVNEFVETYQNCIVKEDYEDVGC